MTANLTTPASSKIRKAWLTGSARGVMWVWESKMARGLSSVFGSGAESGRRASGMALGVGAGVHLLHPNQGTICSSSDSASTL